jgi:hypothetical protein
MDLCYIVRPIFMQNTEAVLYYNTTEATQYPNERSLSKSSFDANESWIVLINTPRLLQNLDSLAAHFHYDTDQLER